MKKYFVVLLIVVFIMSLTGCEEEKKDDLQTGVAEESQEAEGENDLEEYVESEESNSDDTDNRDGNMIEIASAQDLYDIEREPDGEYILTNDIDMSQYSDWTPLCSYSEPFTGTLDGNGYCIRNLNVDVMYINENPQTEYAGLFNCISGATIKNLGICGGTISISSDSMGGMAGALAGGSTVKVEDDNYYVTEISNCYVNATVQSIVIDEDNASFSATMSIGSFIGEGCANFTDCYNLGEVSADRSYADQIIGGFIGSPYTYNQCPMTIKNCYNLGIMQGQHIKGDEPGGFIGAGWKDEYIDIVDSYYGTNANEYNVLRIALTDNKDERFTSVTGLTIEEMQDQNNFQGFDFNNTWAISPDKNGGYPYLQSQKTIPE